MQNFTVFHTLDGGTVKKIARYQQFRAVHKTIERIKTSGSRKDRSGVIWHTQGSGKSLTMVFLSVKIRRDPELRDYKLLFLTDRIELDRQLTGTFQNTQSETIRHAQSVKELKELLKMDASDIVIATIQKSQGDTTDFSNESEKIIVLSDEAHRTQYGTLGAVINAALPNAPRIGFTGTPLIKSEKTTNAFGSYIDTYNIEQAVKDGATVRILYEGREPNVEVARGNLEKSFDEDFADHSDEEKEAIKRRYIREPVILEAPARIRSICSDIAQHYRESIQPNGFKAMIVTSSRKAAIIYKKELDKIIDPHRSTVIISADHNDERDFQEYTDDNKHRRQIEDFRKPLGTGEGQSELTFLIVKDKLLTGFDAPIAQVMYLDCKKTEHSLLQAIARVNRTNEGKSVGYIVDYCGLFDYLMEALKMFSSEDVRGALIELRGEIPRLKEAHRQVLKHFTGKNLEDHGDCIDLLKDGNR